MGRSDKSSLEKLTNDNYQITYTHTTILGDSRLDLVFAFKG